MRFVGTLGLRSREAHMLEGTPDEVLAKRQEHVREQRVEAARRVRDWVEIEEVDLVWRRPFFVSATTDELFQRYRGAAFERQSAWPISDKVDLRYFVGQDGEIVFFEKVSNPATYTEFLEKHAARERAKAAPKPRRVPAEP